MEKISAYAKIGGLMQFNSVNGNGGYELVTGCMATFGDCKDLINYPTVTGNGDESKFF